MAKRYLSLDEAAEQLGLAKEELNRLREKGQIRGFADRGTFKFKAEDVEELGRRLQPSSDPDVEMFGDDDSSVLDEEGPADDEAPSFIRRLSDADAGPAEEFGGSIFDDLEKGGSSDSDVRLVTDERLSPQHDSEPDVLLQMQESDSDVRLESPADSDSDVKINLNDSDSDVRLESVIPVSDSAVSLADSDSDVRLSGGDSRKKFSPADSDSDVQLAPASKIGKKKSDSDSDVALVTDDDSDSDVQLALDSDDEGVPIGPQSDSDVRLLADSDSDVRLLDESRIVGPKSAKGKPDSDSDVAVLSDESGVALELGSGDSAKSGIRGAGSSVLLEDSDIALGPESGISLTGDSGIALTSQSGIALDRVADSGVSLEKHDDVDSGISLFSEEDDGGITLAEDSGIALQMDDDSGISLEGEEDEGLTLGDEIADSGIALKDDDDLQLTETLPAIKIPKRGGASEPGMSDTMLEVPTADAEAVESDFEIGAADGGSQADTSVLLFDDEDETDDAGAAMVKKKASDEEEEEETFEFSEGEEEEVAEAEEDVFAGDEAFEEEGEFGESASDFEAAPAKAAVGVVEYPWGAGVVTTLMVSTAGMLLCALASIDLIRSMWDWQGYNPANGPIIQMLGSLFK